MNCKKIFRSHNIFEKDYILLPYILICLSSLLLRGFLNILSNLPVRWRCLSRCIGAPPPPLYSQLDNATGGGGGGVENGIIPREHKLYPIVKRCLLKNVYVLSSPLLRTMRVGNCRCNLYVCNAL